MATGVRSVGRAVWRRVTKTKHIDADDTGTQLRRCISTKRLTFIGVGKTVGVGIYVLIGVATKDYAGPSVILSFVVAFFLTLMNALCFAEFASRTPKTGAQYTYMYESVGEGVAFIVGWTALIGYVSSMSMAARGWSGYLDSIFSHAIQNFTQSHMGAWSSGPPFTEYPDFPALFIVLVVMVILSAGVNFSSILNSVFAGVSGTVLIFISITGLFYADIDNWSNDRGGFFPHGVLGVVKASSLCFYAFQGFDIIGYSAEETDNPKKAVPRAIISALLIVMVLYLSVSISFTLMVPYWTVNIRSPFPGAFAAHSVTWAKYVVAIGPLLALSNLCLLELFTITRLAYALASDGLLFKVFSKVNPCTHVPLAPILIFGPMVIGLVLALDLNNLVEFMVLYAFIQFSFFASYLIVLRYKLPDEEKKTISGEQTDIRMRENENGSYPLVNSASGANPEDGEDSDRLLASDLSQSEDREDGGDYSNFRSSKQRNREIKNIKLINKIPVKFSVTVVNFASFLLALLLVKGSPASAGFLSVFSILVLSFLIVVPTVLIWCREQRGDYRGFLVPMMPVLPVLCIVANMIMLLSVSNVGSLSAAAILAGIGAFIYMAMVVTDVIRNPEKDQSRDITTTEHSSLLASDLEDYDFEMEVETSQ